MASKRNTPPAPAHVALHGDGCTPVQRVVRLPGEWDLVESEWDDETGVAVHTYEREIITCDSFMTREERTETVKVSAKQPQGRRHDGWRWHDGSRTNGRQADGTIRHF